MSEVIFEGYKIVKADQMCNKCIKAIGKGSVDLTLRGLYTSVGEAQKAISSFLETRKGESVKKGRLDAKKQSNG